VIDIAKESLLSLADAAKQLPRNGGKRPHPATLYRWTMRGLRGAKLEYVQVGATRCTSIEALGRFFAALAAAPAPPPSSLADRLYAADRLERELVEAGF